MMDDGGGGNHDIGRPSSRRSGRRRGCATRQVLVAGTGGTGAVGGGTVGGGPGGGGGSGQRVPYLVTEFIDGPSLAQAVPARGPLRTADVEQLGVAMATALGAIHGRRVVRVSGDEYRGLITLDGRWAAGIRNAESPSEEWKLLRYDRRIPPLWIPELADRAAFPALGDPPDSTSGSGSAAAPGPRVVEQTSCYRPHNVSRRARRGAVGVTGRHGPSGRSTLASPGRAAPLRVVCCFQVVPRLPGLSRHKVQSG